MAGTPEFPERPSQASEATLIEAKGGDMAAFENSVMVNADRLFMALRRFYSPGRRGARGCAGDVPARLARSAASRGAPSSSPGSTGSGSTRRSASSAAGAPRPPPPAPTRIRSDAVADEAPGPQERAEQRELITHLADALAELPSSLREPVLLRDVEGLSTSEAASLLELGEAAFKSRRGRLALRELVAGYLPPPDAGPA